MSGLHTLHQQVQNHPDLADKGCDDQEGLDSDHEVGKQVTP
jgi:hypothetical protein